MMEPKGMIPDDKTCRTKLYYFLQTLWWNLPLLRPLLSRSISMPSHSQRTSAAKGCNLVSVLLVDTLLVYFVQLCLILLITLSLFWTTLKEQQLVMWVSTRSYLCNCFAFCMFSICISNMMDVIHCLMQAVKKFGVVGLFTRGLPLRIVMIGTLTGAQWGIYDAFKVFVGL